MAGMAAARFRKCVCLGHDRSLEAGEIEESPASGEPCAVLDGSKQHGRFLMGVIHPWRSPVYRLPHHYRAFGERSGFHVLLITQWIDVHVMTLRVRRGCGAVIEAGTR